MTLRAGSALACILASAVTIAAQSPQQSQSIEPVQSNTIEPVKARELKGNKQDNGQPNTPPADSSPQSDSMTGQRPHSRQPGSGGDSAVRQHSRKRQQQTNTPPRTNTLDPYQAKPVDPYRATDVTPVHSEPVSPVRGEPVQPVRGTDLQGNVPSDQSGSREQRGNGRWRERMSRGRENDTNHDRRERDHAYDLEHQRSEEAEQARRDSQERQRRETYDRERRAAEERARYEERRQAEERARYEERRQAEERARYERERRGHDQRRSTYVDRSSDAYSRGRGVERRREYFISHDGQRIYTDRDHAGRCIRRYVIIDGQPYEVDSRGRRIVVERSSAGVERRYVTDGNRTRYEYVIDDSGRETLVQRDFWGRVKHREFYAEQPRGTIEVYRADDVQPFQSQGIEEFHADEVQRDQAQQIEPYYAQNVPTRPKEYGPDPRRYPPQQPPARSSGSNSSLMHTFGLAVPGVAYSYDNYATNTRTNVVGTGALTKSSIRINPDHTYLWNSAWDGKQIRGQWSEWHDGGILILHGQEGKDWLLQPLTSATGKATVVLYTDSVQYHGTPLD